MWTIAGTEGTFTRTKSFSDARSDLLGSVTSLNDIQRLSLVALMEDQYKELI